MEHKLVIYITNINLLMKVEFRVNAFTLMKGNTNLYKLNEHDHFKSISTF